jgi:hypothetical protein
MVRLPRPRPQYLGRGMTMQQFAELVCSGGKPVLPVVFLGETLCQHQYL